MQSVSLLISHYFCLGLFLTTSFLRCCANETLFLGIFVDLVSYLSNDIVDFVAEFNHKLVTLQAKVLFCPYKLYRFILKRIIYTIENNFVLFYVFIALLSIIQVNEHVSQIVLQLDIFLLLQLIYFFLLHLCFLSHSTRDVFNRSHSYLMVILIQRIRCCLLAVIQGRAKIIIIIITVDIFI